MNFPKTRKTRTATAIGIAGISALMILGPGSTVADAARKIGSAAIKNNSIRSLDIRNETIRGSDVKDGSLTAQDFSGTMRGARGPRGPAGPAGTNGTNGTNGGAGSAPERTATWQVSHPFDSGNSGVSTSTTDDTIPAGTQIEALEFTATDNNFGTCSFGQATMSVTDASGHGLASLTRNTADGTWRPASVTPGGALNTTPTKLQLRVVCGVEFPGGPPQLSAVPAFDAELKVLLTQHDLTNTVTLN